MKKIILLVLICILLTGCNATYDLEIKSNRFIDEKLTINSNEFNKEQVNIFLNNPITFNQNDPCVLDYDEFTSGADSEKSNLKYYNIKFENNSKLKFEADANILDYKNSRIANSLYNSLNVNVYDDYISIYGFNDVFVFYNYPNLETITVNIKVHNIVNEHNADKVNNNVYTWYYSKNTDIRKTLYIEISNIELEGKEIEENKGYSVYILVSLFIILFLVIIALLLPKKNRY